MLWEQYVFRTGNSVHELWDRLFASKPIKLLYVAGRGFDTRAQVVMEAVVQNLKSSGRNVESATLILVSFEDYELTTEILEQTERNAEALELAFAPLGKTKIIPMGAPLGSEDDISASVALSICTHAVLAEFSDHSDVILDVSSLPRIAYLALITSFLNKIVPVKNVITGQPHPLAQSNVNLQVLVAEDAHLDGCIKAEDPSNDLILIPGFSGGMHAESVRDWPLVWFPILGENRVNQLQKIISLAAIPDSAEICPVLPHPSSTPPRADELLIEYRVPLFDTHRTPTSNILLVHESNPFEAYRQLFLAMSRYKDSMQLLGGCRLVITPLGSKLVTVGAALACFEMRPLGLDAKYAVAIPHAEPKRYTVSIAELQSARPKISALLLTGEAYEK